MTHEEKSNHTWACDLRRGDTQCPYHAEIGEGTFLACVWKDGHPAELPHEAHHDQPYGPDSFTWVRVIPKSVRFEDEEEAFDVLCDCGQVMRAIDTDDKDVVEWVCTVCGERTCL